MTDKDLRNKARFVTMDEIVNTCLMDIREPSDELYELFLHYAYKIFEDLNTGGYFGLKRKALTMNDTYTINLPEDAIDWVVLAQIEGATIRELTKDVSIPLNFKDLYDRGKLTKAVVNENEGKVLYSFAGNTITGEDVGQNFGWLKKHNSPAYFRYDDSCGQFIFKPNETDFKHVYVEYIADMSNQGKETQVPRIMRRLIEAYVHWQYYEHEPNPDINTSRQRDRKFQLYDIEMTKFQAINNDLSIEDIRELFYDAYTLTVNY
jgi:hypothetical protein